MLRRYSAPVRAAVLVAPFLLSGALTVDRAFANDDFAHRRYPGSENKAASEAREARDAPDKYCQKHENECW